MLIPASASASNMSAATPGWVLMPAPISETLAMSESCVKPAAPTSLQAASRIGSATREVGLRQRERDVGQALLGDVLDDHVDVHAGVGERAEDAGGDARAGRARRRSSASPRRCRA